MTEQGNQVPEGGEREAPLEVVGSRNVAPVQSTPATPEQQYYRELLGGFFATLTRWQAILAAEQYLTHKGGSRLYGGSQVKGEVRACDVIATAAGPTITPVRDIHSSGKREPDLLLRLSSHVENDEPEFDSYKKRFSITPGLAGKQRLVDLNGDPFNHIEIVVDKAEFVSYTQWLSVLASTDKGTLAVDYNDNKQKLMRGESAVRGRGVMSDAYASHVSTTIDALIPGTPVVPQQPR